MFVCLSSACKKAILYVQASSSSGMAVSGFFSYSLQGEGGKADAEMNSYFIIFHLWPFP